MVQVRVPDDMYGKIRGRAQDACLSLQRRARGVQRERGRERGREGGRQAADVEGEGLEIEGGREAGRERERETRRRGRL